MAEIFGKRRRWYLVQFAKFQYRTADGNNLKNFFFGKFRATFTAIIVLGTGEIVAQGWWNFSILQYIPWWIVFIALPIIDLITDYYVGELNEKKIKLMQIQAEIIKRRGIDRWEKRKMDILEEMHKKTCPDSKLKKEYYIEEETHSGW